MALSYQNHTCGELTQRDAGRPTIRLQVDLSHSQTLQASEDQHQIGSSESEMVPSKLR